MKLLFLTVLKNTLLNIALVTYLLIWSGLDCMRESSNDESSTVRNDWVLTKPNLYSKLPLFKVPLQMLKVLPELSPLVSWIPYLRTIKNAPSQSWNFKFYEVNIDVLNFDVLYFWGSYSTSFESSWIWNSWDRRA